MFSDVNRQVFNKNVIGLQFKGQKSARIGVKNLIVTFEEENAAICDFVKHESDEYLTTYLTADCKPKTESN